MSPVLDTAFVPPGDREEVVRNAVWESVMAVDIDHGPPAGRGDLRTHRAGRRRADADLFGAGDRRHHPPHGPLARRDDEEPAVFVGLQVSGSSLVAQRGP